MDDKNLSWIYLIQSTITVIALLTMHDILRKFGNYKTTIALITIQIFVFYEIVYSNSITSIAPLMILGLTIMNLISFNLDIFLEKETDLENTGNIRGHFMTIINGSWILGPLIGGMLLVNNDYKPIYFTAFGLLFPLLYIVHKNFSKFTDPIYPKISFKKTISLVFKNTDISKLILVNTVLQVFYAWMTIYTPIYLNKYMGFDWNQIGLIFTIMLIPFVLVQIPLGKLADRFFGEKEIMAIGYIIMGISTIALSYINNNVMMWAIMLFITRIGAASAEIMIETYFFKKIKAKDSEILGVFRVTRPISYFIAPLITVVGLSFSSSSYLFIMLGVICLITLVPISLIEDTK